MALQPGCALRHGLDSPGIQDYPCTMTASRSKPLQPPARATALCAGLLAATLVLAGCNSIGIGIGLPIGGLGSVGVSVDSSGRVGAGVGVGVGPATVGIGGSTQLPARAPEPAASAASAAGGR